MMVSANSCRYDASRERLFVARSYSDAQKRREELFDHCIELLEWLAGDDIVRVRARHGRRMQARRRWPAGCKAISNSESLVRSNESRARPSTRSSDEVASRERA